MFFICSCRLVGKTDQAACKPGSVRSARRRRWMAIPLGRPSPDASRDLPGRPARKAACPAAAEPSPLLGLAPGGVCRAAAVTGSAVRSCRTLSPSPAGASRRPGGQAALCGTFPGVAPAGRYPAPSFRGARTFLPRPLAEAAIRPPDPPHMSRRAPADSSVPRRSMREGPPRCSSTSVGLCRVPEPSPCTGGLALESAVEGGSAASLAMLSPSCMRWDRVSREARQRTDLAGPPPP
jgi:hypothetical protein